MTAEEHILELIERNNHRMLQLEEMMADAKAFDQDERLARLRGKYGGFNMVNQDLQEILENLQENG